MAARRRRGRRRDRRRYRATWHLVVSRVEHRTAPSGAAPGTPLQRAKCLRGVRAGAPAVSRDHHGTRSGGRSAGNCSPTVTSGRAGERNEGTQHSDGTETTVRGPTWLGASRSGGPATPIPTSKMGRASCPAAPTRQEGGIGSPPAAAAARRVLREWREMIGERAVVATAVRIAREGSSR